MAESLSGPIDALRASTRLGKSPDKETIAHQKTGETLTSFRDRYNKSVDSDLEPGNKVYYNDYLRQKGLKNRNIIALQFYANQIKEKLGMDNWNSCKDEFIEGVKKWCWWVDKDSRLDITLWVILFTSVLVLIILLLNGF